MFGPRWRVRAVFLHHETAALHMYNGSPRVFLHFSIVDPGAAFGVELYRAYRVRALMSKPGRNGKFKVYKRSELLLMLMQLQWYRIRPDRVSLEILRGCVLRVTTRTIVTDYKGRELPEALRYSVVDTVVSRETEANP